MLVFLAIFANFCPEKNAPRFFDQVFSHSAQAEKIHIQYYTGNCNSKKILE